jgi:hypothetical protein
MKKIMCIILFLIVLHTVHAQDTGDTGFFDTGDSEALIKEEYESLTSDDLEQVIDSVEDITLLNEYELNEYVDSNYGNSLLMQDAVSGATLTSDGYLTNGEGGSQINLNDIPQGTMIALEQDGSITLYTNNDGFALDLTKIVQEQGPPVTIMSIDSDTYFADGSVLFDNAQLTVYGENIFVVQGNMEYKGAEIRSTTGSVAVIKTDDDEAVQALLESVSEQYTGTVIFSSSRIAAANEVQIIVRESEAYGIDANQGLILSSHKNSAIVYSNNPTGAELFMYGQAVVFDGLRLLQQNSQGQFYSFRGGGDMNDEYNKYLVEQYGYAPKQKDMTIFVYDSLDSESAEEKYVVASSRIADALLTVEEAVEGRVANYFMDPDFDRIPKKKAVLIWSSRDDDKGAFLSVIQTKKQQLIEQGYSPEDIEVLHFTTKEEFFQQLDTVSDTTYIEVVSHGWTEDSGGMIGTENYYAHRTEEDYSVQRKLAVSAENIEVYFNERKQKAGSGEMDSLTAQEGAFCTISTCHSAASYSVYIPETEKLFGATGDEATIAEAFTTIGSNVHVYGSIGPLWLVGYENEQGKWIRDLVPVSDMTSIFEGTANPATETVLTQDIVYIQLQ